MGTTHQTRQEARVAELEARLAEAEETLRAIRSGEVDAVVVNTQQGEQVFTLRGAEVTYRMLVEAMSEGALLLGPEGTVLYANLRFATLAGVPLEQVIGAPWSRFFPDTQRAALDTMLQSADHAGLSREFELQQPNDQRRPVWLSLASMRMAGVEGISVVVTDLTERKAAEAKTREFAHELEAVSYAIVHDMRAPLRAMQAFAHMLTEDSGQQTPDQRKDLARRITIAACRLDELIRDALAYNQAVVQPVHMQPVDLAKLVPGLLDTYPNLAPGQVDIHIENRLPVVIGNEAFLTQCFANLLGNAVKFVAPGVRPCVRIRSEPANDYYRIWIEDNGIGIPPQAIERLFNMFQRLTREYEGTGIGLAIVRKVVQRMGGRLGVESQPGNGSRFWVELKRAG
ncbi:MAG TPA: PAS domain-containing sensor histidine kinase [Verrucomicrobiae bacterium]|nr:PAS domain-containing sensor histidine kinase [Verrucomicrobiae bacterium]